MHLPAARNAAQLVHAVTGELEQIVVEQAQRGTGDEHLAAVGELADARGDVHGHPGQAVAQQLALAGVNAGPQLDAEAGSGNAQLLGAAHRRCGRVERDQEAVAAVGEHAAAGGVDRVVHDLVMLLEQFTAYWQPSVCRSEQTDSASVSRVAYGTCALGALKASGIHLGPDLGRGVAVETGELDGRITHLGDQPGACRGSQSWLWCGRCRAAGKSGRGSLVPSPSCCCFFAKFEKRERRGPGAPKGSVKSKCR